ncbi:MAG: hypothetical protein QOG94_272 [Solirubrobacteraceae bacterium]|jgi:hypothetical protein|nr:hypothetical protein [Solirubrobacteraceae bacterium]MEA2139559.1 hypothetical protein [Solirubrobacteraceae bacterium]
MRRITITTAALVLTLAATAHAQETTIAGSLTPNTAGAGTRVHVEVGGAAPELAGALPESVALGVQRGFALDARAVAVRCTGDAATTGKCPVQSRIGVGQAVVRTSGFLNRDIPATLDVFLGDAVAPGDVASAVVVISAAGLSGTVRTRLLAPATGPVGYELRIEGIAAAVPAIPGVAFGLRSLSLDLGASRKVTKTTYKRVRVTRHGRRVTVRRKVKRRVTYDLLRNPTTCGGAWGVRLTVRVAGTDRVRDVAVPCVPA